MRRGSCQKHLSVILRINAFYSDEEYHWSEYERTIKVRVLLSHVMYIVQTTFDVFKIPLGLSIKNLQEKQGREKIKHIHTYVCF
jgi:hypothetical protein